MTALALSLYPSPAFVKEYINNKQVYRQQTTIAGLPPNNSKILRPWSI
jgi:hypothetical protein